jgi:hypothetical protein
MREDELASAGSDVPNWDQVVAIDPDEAAAIQVDPEVAIRIDPDVEILAPIFPGFEDQEDEEEDEPEPVDTDPDFDDEAEISLLHELGIDLDAPDAHPDRGLDFHFVLEPDPEDVDVVDDEVAA